MARFYGLWCWRLRIPLVCFERCTPHSRYGRVHLDMLTTQNALTAAGQSALKALAGEFQAREAACLPADQGGWDRVPLARLPALSAAAFKAAVQAEHYRLNRSRSAAAALGLGKPLKLVARRASA